MALLCHEGFSYEPKAVVVALFPENDLLDNMGIPPAACPWPPAPARKPPLLLPGFLRQAAGSSALLKACTDRVPALSNLVRPGSIRAERALVRGLFHLWHATPTEIQNRMWKRLAEVVGAMKDSVEAHDAAFGALIVPGRLALYPDEVTRLIRRQPMLRTADLDFALPRIRLAALLDSLQVPSLDLGPAFREASHTGADPLFPQEGHWTAEGNRLAAEGLRTLVIGHHMLDAPSPERAPAAPGLTPGR
jgi:hypothetical protein